MIFYTLLLKCKNVKSTLTGLSTTVAGIFLVAQQHRKIFFVRYGNRVIVYHELLRPTGVSNLTGSVHLVATFFVITQKIAGKVLRKRPALSHPFHIIFCGKFARPRLASLDAPTLKCSIYSHFSPFRTRKIILSSFA